MTQTRLANKLSKFLGQRYSYQQIQKYEATNKIKINSRNCIPGFSKILNKPLETFFLTKEEQDNAIIFAGKLEPNQEKVDGQV